MTLKLSVEFVPAITLNEATQKIVKLGCTVSTHLSKKELAIEGTAPQLSEALKICRELLTNEEKYGE